MTTLHFAQLSDVHISRHGDQYDMLSGRTAGFLADIVSELNRIESLDFVLMTGDLLVDGHSQELKQFQQAVEKLRKPCYIIPGNHDYRPPDSNEGLTRHDFAAFYNPQFEARPTGPGAQSGYWSQTVKPGVQLIGLDSNRDEDWGGVIDEAQLAWFEAELAANADKLILLAVHHPLHMLAPIDHQPKWRNFVLKNGPALLALLDRYPQVKLVLTGHHHLTRADTMSRRLHLASPAVAIYPCAYRTLHLSQKSRGRWRIRWQTQPATNPTTIAEARQVMIDRWTSIGFEPDFVLDMVRLAEGSAEDRAGEIVL